VAKASGPATPGDGGRGFSPGDFEKSHARLPIRDAGTLVPCLAASYSRPVNPLRARVENGRLVLDEPTTLPDGTVVDLVVDDQDDDLVEEERRALHEALSRSWNSVEAGRLKPASEILDELRRRR
jgi:hypothetical protein